MDYLKQKMELDQFLHKIGEKSNVMGLLDALRQVKGMRIVDSNFTVDGVEATVISDFDNQRYRLTLKKV